jgi:hypothetical protein
MTATVVFKLPRLPKQYSLSRESFNLIIRLPPRTQFRIDRLKPQISGKAAPFPITLSYWSEKRISNSNSLSNFRIL